MKVLRLHGPRDLRLHDEPEPVAKPDEQIVRVTAVGICGSDLHWFAESGIGDARLDRPLVLGHEFAGVIESGPRRGQRVAIDPAVPCEQCEYCQDGHPNLCANIHFAGHGADDGALRERMAWPERNLHPIPDSLTDADGAMLEPLGVAIHAIDLAHIRPGMTVGVFGCGPIGLLILQLARAAGATRLYATEVLPHRIAAAQAFGARVFHADGEEAKSILTETGKRGVDVAIETAGTNEAVEAAIGAVKPGGTVVLVGIPSEDSTTFTASVARRKGLTIRLSRRMKRTYPRAIALVEQGMVDIRSIVTAQFPLAEAGQAFTLAQKREGLKIVITPTS
ncbi:MAG: zinc-dependent alcohol dehydrogenase [Candidatus Roseilinea sp.]|uniref:zinc-dependent alcohol dehydrogenase n=1 Tax=Candidatus Roseilinea sp. TaxID=2838777 RepID=UPI0040495B83